MDYVDSLQKVSIMESLFLSKKTNTAEAVTFHRLKFLMPTRIKIRIRAAKSKIIL